MSGTQLAAIVADPAVLWLLRVAGALLFLSAAHHKLRSRPEFRAALSAYRLLPDSAISVAALWFAVAEVSVGIGLLIPVSCKAAAWGGVGLLALYSGAVAVNLARGRRYIDCGCGRPAARRPLSVALLMRNAVLIALAWLAAQPAAVRPWTWLDAFTVAAGVLTAALLYAAVEAASADPLGEGAA